MPRFSVCCALAALVFAVSCAKTPKADRSPSSTPRADSTADPIDPLVAHAALAVKFDLTATDEIAAVFDALGAGDGRVDASRHSDGRSGMESVFSDRAPVLARLLEAPESVEAVDEEAPAYFALTPQGNPQFLNALELSPIVPIEEDPRWLHSRLVVGAREGMADELGDELRQWLVPDEDGEYLGANWRVRVVGNQVVADHLLALSPGVDADVQPALDTVTNRAWTGTRRASAARMRFARSQSPTAVYFDYRRIGRLLAIEQGGRRLERFAEESARSEPGDQLPLLARWVSTNNAIGDLFRSLNRRRLDYADLSLEPLVVDGRLTARAITTRTDTAARSREASADEAPPIAIHPDQEVVLRFEATSGGDDHYSRRAIARWLGESDRALDFDALVARYTEAAPWLLLGRPTSGLTSLFAGQQSIDPPRAVRVSVYESPSPQEGVDGADISDGSEEAEFHTLVSAAFDRSTTVENRLRRVARRALGDDWDWRIEQGTDHLKFRATSDGDINELLPETSPGAVPDEFSMRGDADRILQWRDQQDFAGLRVIPEELFSLLGGPFQVTTRHRDAYVEVIVGDGIDDVADYFDDTLSDDPVVLHQVPPACALDTRTMIDRFIDEFRQTSAASPDRSEILVRRAMPIIDNARRCERNYPQIPRFSRVMGRNLWALGIREENAGRLPQATALYQQGCELEEPISCRYFQRIRRAGNVDLPQLGYEIRGGQPAGKYSAFVRSFISVDHLDRVSVGDRTVGTVDELADERVRERIAESLQEQLLPTPLALVGADSQLREDAANTVGLAIPGDIDAVFMLDNLTTPPLGEESRFQAFVDVGDSSDGQPAVATANIDVRRSDLVALSGGRAQQVRIHLQDRGIDVFDGRRRIAPVTDCPRTGPTVCLGRRGPVDDVLPVDGLLSVMPEIATWRGGQSRLVVVVDTDISWGEFAQLVALAQNPNHPAWRPATYRPIGLFSPRLGTPYQSVEVIIDR